QNLAAHRRQHRPAVPLGLGHDMVERRVPRLPAPRLRPGPRRPPALRPPALAPPRQTHPQAGGPRRRSPAGMAQHRRDLIQVSREPRLAAPDARGPFPPPPHYTHMGWRRENDTVRLVAHAIADSHAIGSELVIAEQPEDLAAHPA